MVFEQFASLHVMNGETRRSCGDISDKSYNTSSCPSVVLRSRQKLVGDLSMNACTQHDLHLRRRRRLTTLAPPLPLSESHTLIYHHHHHYHHHHWPT